MFQSNFSVLLIVFVVFISELEITSGQNRFQQPQRGQGGNGQQRCVLEDIQGTAGECMDIRTCKYGIGLLRAGVQVKKCPGGQKDIVCCPTELTISQKKCQEWQDILRQPEFFGHSPYPEPQCAYKQLQHLIVGGRAANQFEFPHSVALGYGDNQNRAQYKCGGTLISERYVMTAAHCVKTGLKWALLGDITLKQQTAPYRKVMRIVQTIVHPEYNPPISYNDIALLQLSEDVEISRYILPACLADPMTNPTEGQVEAVGWGMLGASEKQSDNLQAVNLTIIKPKDCNSYFTDPSEKRIRYPDGLIRSQLCAGDKEGEKDTCNGDSGGPLTINPRVRCLFYAVGVTSFGAKLCGYGQPGVYTKVLSHVDWIERTIWR